MCRFRWPNHPSHRYGCCDNRGWIFKSLATHCDVPHKCKALAVNKTLRSQFWCIHHADRRLGCADFDGPTIPPIDMVAVTIVAGFSNRWRLTVTSRTSARRLQSIKRSVRSSGAYIMLTDDLDVQ